MEVKSEIAGKVWQIVGKPGDAVAEDQEIVILESMKMEIPITAPAAGRIESILVDEADNVQEGQIVAILQV